MPYRFGRLSKAILCALPLKRNDVGNRKSFLSIFNRWRQNAAHWKLSVSLMQFIPARDRAWNSHRVHTKQRDRLEAALLEEINGSLAACPTAPVQTDRPRVLLHEDKRKHIPADSGGTWLDNIQNGGG